MPRNADTPHPHRGRFQAQGVDIPQNSGTVAKAWGGANPLPEEQGHSKLDDLKGMLTSGQQANRSTSFSLAHMYVRRAKASGGVTARWSRSCPQNKIDSDDDRRVDIEVLAGKAFV